ncbi:U-box domain-containing protein 13 [Dendrobium catenatum]|uniref:RING-type E3 ubiquitin transferase n=1 Tax=Dendrobium catenatum TaxID=906689 RepID=A0A2I0VXI6_9ASPA|nr:U-box domain-containing protein 13 [Dendrobium catenatum]
MSGLELVPIGTFLSLLIEQVILTAKAIDNVLIEKECFKTLSKYLLDIVPILEELQRHELNDTPTVRHTLEFLKENCDNAENLVLKYKDSGRFYSFLFCRRIANEIQEATRAIGKSLAMLPLAKTEVLYEISDMVNKLQAEMQKAEYVASQSSLMILEKLNKGIKEQKHDQNFRNSMLEQIALSVGVSIVPAEIRKELDSLRMEREEAAARKEKQEEIFLKQVIELLSHADAALDEDEIRRQYELIRNTVEKSAISNGKILEYDAFLCPITKSVMVDPVNLFTGTTCEKAAIEAWFLEGRKEDPCTGKPLADTTLRPNISVRQSIQQWREQNYFLKIRRAKEILQSGNSAAYDDAFCEITKVIKENLVTKYWIAMEGLIDIIVLLVGTLDGNLKSRSLQTLLDIVHCFTPSKRPNLRLCANALCTSPILLICYVTLIICTAMPQASPKFVYLELCQPNSLSKIFRHLKCSDKAVEAGIFNHIIACVRLDYNVCTSAANLLFELLQENDRWGQAIQQEDCRWNPDFCRKLKQLRGTIAFLVLIILDNQFSESAKKMEAILLQLCCDDDATILDVASYHWYKPLVRRLRDGFCDRTLKLDIKFVLGNMWKQGAYDRTLSTNNSSHDRSFTHNYSPESSKQTMMRGLEKMQLLDEDVKHLGEDGVINPLVILASGDAKSRELAFSVMAKLCTSFENRRLTVEAGAVSLILEQISSPQVSPIIREKCSGIFEKLTSSGLEFLNGTGIVLPQRELMITNLIGIFETPSTSIGIRKPAFRALLSLCKSAKVAAENAIASQNGLSIILPLLEDSDKEIQKLALELIHQFSQNESSRIADFLLDGTRLETLMPFLEDESQPELQLLAVELLTNLQKSNIELIKGLAKSGAIPLILHILNRGTMEAKENVLDLLVGFMNPADIEMQKRLVESGAYPLLVNILISGSKTAKARAAALIGNLSSNSLNLTEEPNRTGCFCFLRKKIPTCEVHGGICSVESSFCLLKADALKPLVNLLDERDDAVKLKAILALKTLVEGIGSRGVICLHRFKAIKPMLDVLREENPALKEEVLEMLEMLFKVREVLDSYTDDVKIPLIHLSAYRSGNTNDHLRIKAAKLLADLELYSKSGSSPL